jgi:hypothetical protein
MTTSSSSASPRWHWLSLLLLPAVVTVAVPDWMYSTTSAIDAWVYHGFFRHLETYASTMFPPTYYGSRLAWIVPGYIAYHVFSPVTAAVILHLIFYLTAVASLYAIVRRLFGASNALFSSVAFGLYLPAIRALGWDYVDGAVITYTLLAQALLLAGLERNSRLLTAASGVAAGAMLHSSIGAAFMFPSMAIWFLPDRASAWHWRQLLVPVAWWGAGIIGCTALLSIISVSVGGSWDFFMPSIRWMIEQRLNNPTDVTGFAWIATASWFFFPAAVFLASLVVLLHPQRRAALTTGERGAIISLVICFLIFVAWDHAGNGALLYTPFYTSWLLPWSFIAIGAVLANSSERARWDVATVLVCAVAMVFSLMRPSFVQLPLTGFAGIAFAIGVMAFVTLIRARVVRRLALVALLVCMHGWLSATTEYGPYPDRADGFQVISRGVGIVDRHITEYQPRFLLAPLQTLGHYVQGLTSIYLWGYTIATDQFPMIAPEQARQIRDGTRVVVIAEQEGAAAPFDEVFAPYRLRGRLLANEQLMTAHGLLYLTFLEAVELPSNDASQPADSQTASPTPDRP